MQKIGAESPEGKDQGKDLELLMGSLNKITAAMVVRGTLIALRTPASTVDDKKTTAVPPKTPNWKVMTLQMRTK
ncbi:unnamed protein product [Ilex paraguariensis]|uniref:Uncharacterized protein n=1 Tax=Ilex paraguariensis TaxID=185542 RepID=A0ABC8TIQ0_9AQUA